MSTFYRQCTFQQGNTHQTAWVEEAGIAVGVKVRFKDENDWWKVVAVGDERMPEKEAKKQERLYLHQRAASDI